jgi:hypothetical protein
MLLRPRPILNFQTRHPAKFPLVVGNKRKTSGMGRNPEIVIADQRSSP